MIEESNEEQQEQAQAPEEATQETEGLLDSSTELQPGEYFLIEGIKGTGEAPEWFNGEKYKSVAEQAKAQRELEKKFGSFTGAPKDGYSLPEGFDSEDALAQEVIKFGQETNLSQDGFDKLMQLAQAQAGVTDQVSRENELKKLGSNAAQRIKQVETFIKHKAGDQYDTIKDMVTDANSVMLVESIMKAIAPAPLPIDGVEVSGKPSWEEVQVEMFKKDDNGNLLRSVNREHEMKIQRLLKEYGGTRANTKMFG